VFVGGNVDVTASFAPAKDILTELEKTMKGQIDLLGQKLKVLLPHINSRNGMPRKIHHG
jgi:hypothetical protein